MRIRITQNSVLVRHVVHSAGDIVEVADESIARRLVAQGAAVLLADAPPPPAVETATMPPGPEAADAPPARKRKG